MDIRVLGPVELFAGGKPVDLGPRRQRFVFGVLALDANRLVPIDRLIELAWPADAPRTAVHAIRVMVSRLRGVLHAAGTGGVEIVTRGTSYLLRTDPSRVDAARFLTLLDDARTAADAEHRFATLSEALALWSGPVLSGAAPAQTRERLSRRLDEARLAANRDLIETGLGLGRHERLVPDLERLAAEHPFDERLHQQLTLALYRSGRQADALAVCRRLRGVLNAELGIEPGQPVRDLERAILRQDPGLDLAATTGVADEIGPAAPPSPAQLPPALASFTGRADALARLQALLAADPEGLPTAAMAVVSGTAGVGKSALAVRWAHRAASRFPDGQLYINMRGFDPSARSVDPGDAVRGFLDALGAPARRVPAGLDEQTALYRSLLAGKRVLVLVDNARDAAQVRPLLPGAPGCLTVVTSRNQLMPLVVDGAVPVTLDLLSPGEARDLLRGRLGAARVAAEPTAVREILERCARLPLALAIVAGRAAAHPAFALTDLAAELRDAAGGLDALDAGDPSSDVRSALSWSYRGLSEPAAELFRLLGRHAGPDIGVGAAASLAGRPMRAVRATLEQLTGGHLLAEPAPGRFAMHDLLRALAAELPEPAGSADARRRLVDHYAQGAYAAVMALDPLRTSIEMSAPVPGVVVETFEDRVRALAWFDGERPALLAALGLAAAHRLDASAWQLSWALAKVLERRGRWQDVVTVQRTAEVVASRLGGREQAHVHLGLAMARARERRLTEAHDHVRSALALAESAGDGTMSGNANLTAAQVYARQADFDAALRHSTRALEVFRTTDDSRGIGFSLNAVGWYHAKRGDPHATIDFCEMALNVLREDRYGQASTWDSLGYAYHLLDQHDRAVDCYRRAIGLFRDLGDRYEETTCLTALGEVHAVRDPAAARIVWERALEILDQLGDPDADALRDRLARQEPDREPTMTGL